MILLEKRHDNISKRHTLSPNFLHSLYNNLNFHIFYKSLFDNIALETNVKKAKGQTGINKALKGTSTLTTE